MKEADLARRQIEDYAGKFFAITGARKPAANAIFVLVMGMTGAGKSRFVSTCTGKELMVGHTLRSCECLIKDKKKNFLVWLGIPWKNDIILL